MEQSQTPSQRAKPERIFYTRHGCYSDGMTKISKSKDELPSGYGNFIIELKEQIRTAQIRASLSVNRELILLYWGIGRSILERQDKEGWGAKIIDMIAGDIRREFPTITGFSPRNIKYMRALALAWEDKEIVQQLVAQIPWGHNCRVLDSLKDSSKRKWYIQKTIQHGWSRAVLVHQIESNLHERQAVTEKSTNFELTLPKPDSDLANELVKDPYNFEFLTLADEAHEKELHRGLVKHLQEFLLELGAGFAFVGSNYHLDIGKEDYYLDLLFYHLHLRRYIVIELKTTRFKPEYAGKLNFYLSVVDDLLRHRDDQSSIGLLLCKTKNKVTAEYALHGMNNPIGVADYQTTKRLPEDLQEELPSIDELESRLNISSTGKKSEE